MAAKRQELVAVRVHIPADTYMYNNIIPSLLIEEVLGIIEYVGPHIRLVYYMKR